MYTEPDRKLRVMLRVHACLRAFIQVNILIAVRYHEFLAVFCTHEMNAECLERKYQQKQCFRYGKYTELLQFLRYAYTHVRLSECIMFVHY